MTSPAAASPESSLVRAPGVRQLTASIVNVTVGAGIFVLPAAVAAGLTPGAAALSVRNGNTLLQQTVSGEAVARALAGCDAVVHAAANVNIHATDALETIRTNRRGTELVITGVAGCTPAE